MKTYLFFNKKGEIYEKKTKCKKFEKEDFPEFSYFKTYGNYIVLYNTHEECKNLTVLYFTKDTFKSDISLIKIDNDMNIQTLTFKEYSKEIDKKDYEIFEEEENYEKMIERHKDLTRFFE